MLDMQTKMNRFGAPVEFNVTQHDAAEFNSSMDEIKNAITDQGGILTAATIGTYLNDDTHQLNKSIIAGGGWIMPTASVNSTTATFTTGAAGVDNLPELVQYTDKLLRFISSSVPNTGAYTISYDGDVSSLIDISGNPLSFGELPANTIVEIFYDGADWVLNAVFNPESGGYIYGNSGVIFAGNEITDFCTDTRNFQLGERGMLVGESDDDVWFGYNAYCQAGSGADEFEKIQAGEWAGRTVWDAVNGRYVLQYALDSDPNSDFSFRDAWGMTEKGDFFYGENPTIDNPTGDSAWIYTWYPQNKVSATNKLASGDDFTFRGTNIYPTGTAPVMNVISTGDWEFTIESTLGGKIWYKGTGTGGTNFSLSSQPELAIAKFVGGGSGTKFVQLNAPVALGGLLDPDFLDTDPTIVQHQLGVLSTLQSSKGGILYDVWGSGFRTETILGSTLESSFNALPDTMDISSALTLHQDGSVLGIGSEGSSNTGHVAKKPLVGGVIQIDVTTDIAIPNSAINSLDLATLFYVEANTVAGTAILRSLDAGLTWVQVHTEATGTYMAGITRLRDNTIVAVRYVSQIGGTGPIPIYSNDNGDTWTVGGVVPGSANPNVTLGNIYFTFIQHSDGTVFYAARSTAAAQRIQIWSAPSVDGTFTLVGDVGANANGTPALGCSFIDPATDDIYIGMQDDTGNQLIRKSVNKGVSFVTVFTGTSAYILATPIKIISTPEGHFYAINRTGLSTVEIIRSLDGGVSWTVVIASTSLTRDIIYNANDASLYLIRDNNAGGIGFIVEAIAVEKEYATSNVSLPVKLRMFSGALSTYIAPDPQTAGDLIPFGLAVQTLTRTFWGILQSIGSATLHAFAPPGSLFRNEADDGNLWVKELNGDVYPVNGVFDPTLLTPSLLTPDPANTGASGAVEIGAGSTRGSFSILTFPDSGDDFYYAQIQPPANWYSKKIRFRVSYIVRAAISAPAVIGWELGIRKIVKNMVTTNNWVASTEAQTLPDTTVDLWRKTDYSGIITLSSFDPGVDTLDVRINRDNSVGDNEDGDALFSEVEIKWLP